MASKKINNLILKSTNYGSGVATNKPLDVKDFEGNFVTLADGINDIDVSISDLKITVKNGDKEKVIIKGRVDALETAVQELSILIRKLSDDVKHVLEVKAQV